MSYYLADPVTSAILWEIDCETAESRESTVRWTDKPIESGANAARFGIEEPDRFTIEGIVTAWPFDIAGDKQRITTADQSLRDLMKRRQPVTCVAGYWSAQVVIESVSGGAALGDAEEMKFRLGLKTIKLVEPEVTKMPPARMKPKPKKRGAKGKKGGKQTTKKPDGAAAAASKKRTKSWAARLLDSRPGR